MAVFTPLSLEECRQWCSNPITGYTIGEVVDIYNIASGIENSNFFIDVLSPCPPTVIKQWVLTLFEKISATELPFYLMLQKHLGDKNIPVPVPQQNISGEYFSLLKGRPATIVSKLAGAPQLSPNPQHCKEIGHWLARMHLAVADFENAPINPRGLHWWHKIAAEMLPHLPRDIAALFSDELAQQDQFAQMYSAMGSATYGAVHADVFRNNVMFEQETLSGIFDFYFAGADYFIFDLAVTANDWCIAFNKDGNIDIGDFYAAHLQALLSGYQSVKPLNPAEKKAFPAALRTAAMRFWTSRLYDKYMPRQAVLLQPHDPGHFENILLKRRNEHTHQLDFF